MNTHLRSSLALLLLALSLLGAPLQAQFNDIDGVSVNDSGTQANGAASLPSLNGDGKMVLFQSSATNLTGSSDTNGATDLFLRNRASGTTIRVSESSTGINGNGASSHGVLSADGAYVAFETIATNLLGLDSNARQDVVLRKNSDSSLAIISSGMGGSAGNGDSSNPSISGDGAVVAYESQASNLESTSDSNGVSDIYVYSRATGTNTRASVSNAGTIGNGASSTPSISADGRYVAFTSFATNLTNTQDSNATSDVFIRDLQTASTRRVSVSSSGIEGNGASSAAALSSNGRYVAFQSLATNLTDGSDTNGKNDVFLADTQTGDVVRVSSTNDGSSANGQSVLPALSADGNTLVFLSDATNLVPNDGNNTAQDGHYDVFVYTRSSATLQRISTTFTGSEKTGSSTAAAISADGKTIAFDSTAALVDLSSGQQIFVVDQNCSADQDNDGTVNCSDACPSDASKIVRGSCGCGIAEVDTDGDGVSDCVDQCSHDFTKSSVGICGCNVADIDTDSNGVMDCRDPAARLTPRTPTVLVRKRTISVRIPSQFDRAQFIVTLSHNGKRIAKRTTHNHVITFALRHAGKYSVSYRVRGSRATTKVSKKSVFVIR